ncbi:MAG TPA: RidA family protein [Marinobacter sp.]|nr:RidA family protein [Marinobacter sp.]
MNPYPVNTNLPASKSPLAWATVGNGILFTAQIPIDAEGKVVDGGIEPQIKQTLANLKHTLESAGTSVANLTQVLIYVTDREDLAAVNREYATFVAEPFPNRAAIIVSGFARAEMLVEIVAYAVVPE